MFDETAKPWAGRENGGRIDPERKKRDTSTLPRNLRPECLSFFPLEGRNFHRYYAYCSGVDTTDKVGDHDVIEVLFTDLVVVLTGRNLEALRVEISHKTVGNITQVREATDGAYDVFEIERIEEVEG